MLVDDENKKIKSSLAQLIGALIYPVKRVQCRISSCWRKMIFLFFLEAQDVEENGKSVKKLQNKNWSMGTREC
jgi:hypothetical protein